MTCSPTPPAALFAGLAVLPKKSALTELLLPAVARPPAARSWPPSTSQMIGAGLATSDEAVFDLDFHAVMHWGRDPALEKHYVPTRSQRARSVLTFFAQDTGTHNLVYANADLSKATQAREVIAFCDHWKAVSGADPKMLIMDQKVTTQARPRRARRPRRQVRSPCGCAHPPWSGTSTAWPRQGLHHDHPGPARPAQQAESPRGPRRHADQLPRHRPPAHRHRPGPRRRPPSSSPTTPDHHPRPDQPVRPPDDHRAAARRDHPRVLRRRPVLHRQPQRRPRRHALRPRPGPDRRPARPGCPATRPSPPTPSSGASSTPPARSSPPHQPSPSASNAAPSHPSSAKQTSQPHPRPLVGRPPHPLRVRLTLPRTSCGRVGGWRGGVAWR